MINTREETKTRKGMARKGITGCGMRDAILNTGMREGCKDQVMFEWILKVEKEVSYANNYTECIPGRGSSRRKDWGQRLDGLFKKQQAGYFPGGSVVKNPPCNAGDMGLIPDSGAHMEPEWMILHASTTMLHATTKTWCSQINKLIKGRDPSHRNRKEKKQQGDQHTWNWMSQGKHSRKQS